MGNLDNRVRYTKTVLQQALLKILKNKHIDKVTIKELCEEAQINRGTFYLHYSTPNDLLMEIEQQFIEENMAYFSRYMNDGYEMDQMSHMFTFIMEHPDISSIIFGKNGNPRFVERMMEMLRPSVIQSWQKEFPDYDRRDLEYVYEFLFWSGTRMMINWMENDEGISPQEFAHRLHCLGHYSHLAITEFHK